MTEINHEGLIMTCQVLECINFIESDERHYRWLGTKQQVPSRYPRPESYYRRICGECYQIFIDHNGYTPDDFVKFP